MGRRITQTKVFWFAINEYLTPEKIESDVNRFLKETPGILTTVDFEPQLVWSEIGNYIVCYVTYQTTAKPNRR